MGLSLRWNVSWMAVGEGVESLCKWGVLAVLTKLSNVETVGLFGLAMALTAPIILFFGLGLRQAQATDVRGEFLFKDYFRLRSTTNVLACLLVLLVGAGLGYSVETIIVVALVGLFKAMTVQRDVYYGLFQFHHRMDFIARSKLIRGPLVLLFFAFGILLTGELSAGVVGMLAASLMVLLMFDRRHGRRFLPNEGAMSSPERNGASSECEKFYRTDSIKRVIRLSLLVLPLGIVGVLGSLQANIPRLLVEANLDLAALGFFTGIVAIYGASTRLVNALAQAGSTRLARAFDSGNRLAFVRLLAKLGLLGVGLGGSAICVAYFFGEAVLSLLYTKDYGAYSTLFVFVMIAAFFRYLANLWQMGIVAARQFRLIGFIHLCSALVVVVSSMMLIPAHGLTGAAMAMILAAGTQMAAVVLINVWLVHGLQTRVTET
jgi:O-antigen/teichoic acid export membrane protein